ncbi:NAD(P)-binding protein, partial [Cylindrobasidium torrendii FP15055 ss-10]
VKSQPPALTALAALGAYGLLKTAITTTSFFLQTFVLSGYSLKKFGAKKGAWAVVTGASDGIGKEFAMQLAKGGFNILLIARNQTVLNETAAEISAKYPQTQTQTLSMDFSRTNDENYAGLAAAVADLDVGVLVNNVGRSHNMPVYFHETPKDEMDSIVNINVNATLRVTYTILPGMVVRKRGLILNIGSFAGSVPSPMLATYSGTKAFLSTFTSALAEEYAQHKIVVEHVNTYFVVSKLSKIRKPSALIPLPRPFVSSVLSKIGNACGAVGSGRPQTSTPYWSHAALEYFMTLLARPTVFIKYSHNLHKDIRRRALRKAEREAKAQ